MAAVGVKRQHGRPLFEAGYKLVPIARGKKDPRTKGWQNLRVTDTLLEEWLKSTYYAGLGVLGEFTPGVDIDVSDPVITDKLVKWCHTFLGFTPIRIGNAPRVMLPYRAPEGGLGPDNSPAYMDADGVKHQVEIKATGQQWVAYGQHPTTKLDYTWDMFDLEDFKADDLPVITGADIKALFAYFESIVPADWELKTKGSARRRTGGIGALGELEGVEAFENYSPPINITTDKVQQMLAQLDPDGFVNVNDGVIGWRAVGMALYHQYEGSEEGKRLFVEWSSRSIEFNLDEIEHRWPSWGADSYGSNPVTAATLVAAYNAVMKEKSATDPTLRRKGESLASWVERFGMVELKDGIEVHDFGVPIWKAKERTFKAFKEQTASYVYETITADGDSRMEFLADAWRGSRDTRHYMGYTYRPGEDRVCCKPFDYGSDDLYVNRFFFPPHEEILSAADHLDVFFKFMDHLFPASEEREWLYAWMARLVQFPGVRSFVTPVSVTPITGTGRGLFFEILQSVVGAHNVHDVSQDDLSGRFNGFLDSCIVAVVQEIKAATGDKKYSMWERMKSLLADTTSNIQRKGIDAYTSPIYANFIMFSNNLDALPISGVNERRIYAMRGANTGLGQDIIKELNAWRAGAVNIAALFSWLRDMDISGFNFNRAPVTETKIQMAAATSGEGGELLDYWLAECGAPQIFTGDLVMEKLSELAEGDFGVSVSAKAVGAMLRSRGYSQTRIRTVDDGRVRVWYPHDLAGSSGARIHKLYIAQL